MIDDELLNKFSQTPGLCTILELSKVKKFLLTYKGYHDKYVQVMGHEPLGFTLDSELQKVDAYIDRKR